MINWVVCRGNSGYLVNNGLRERRKTAFDKDAIGQVKNIQGEEYEVWLIGCNQTFLVPSNEVEYIDIHKQGIGLTIKFAMFVTALSLLQTSIKTKIIKEESFADHLALSVEVILINVHLKALSQGNGN